MSDASSIVITDRSAAEAFLDERIGHGVQPGLDRIAGLLGFMGDPQATYPSIHVAGTNGKTTTSRMIQQILGAHGLAVGGFTSPHLSTIEERFSLFGSPVSSDVFTQAVSDIAWFVVGYEESSGNSITYFEVTAALAFTMFADAAVDVAVAEVGLGGRLDATNVLDADVSLITGIDIDHVEFLGSTIAEIAAEKAAILKQEGVLVTGPLPGDAIAPIAERVGAMASTWMRFGTDFAPTDVIPGVGGWQCTIEGIHDEYRGLFLPVHGRHQVDHLASSIASSEMFLGHALDHDSLAIAVASMTSPGRLEPVARRPLVIIDGAHNRQGFEGLARSLDEEFPSLQWQLVIGVRGERTVEDLVSPLTGLVGHVYATAANDPASLDKAAVGLAASRALGVDASPVTGVQAAVAEAISAAGPDGGVVVAGSLYVVGEARSLFDVPPDRGADAHLRFESEPSTDEEVDDDSAPDYYDRDDRTDRAN